MRRFAKAIAPLTWKFADFKQRLAKDLVEFGKTCVMLKQLVEYVLSVLNLARDTRTNKEEIVELRRELDELTNAVERLSFELRAVREEDRHERDKLLLRIENTVLRIERQLPPTKEPRKLR